MFLTDTQHNRKCATGMACLLVVCVSGLYFHYDSLLTSMVVFTSPALLENQNHSAIRDITWIPHLCALLPSTSTHGFRVLLMDIVQAINMIA